MSDQPDDELIRELYARFGLAYYQSECLHRELCFVFALSGLPPPEMIASRGVDERLAEAYHLTRRDVATILERVLPAALAGRLRQYVVAPQRRSQQCWVART